MIALAAATCLLGCGDGAEENDDSASGKRKIVCTCGMVTDIVKQVVGDKAEVVGLLGAGVDPHTHKPTSQDVRELNSADIVIYSGLHLEGNFIETFEQLEKKGRPVIAVGEAIEQSSLREFVEDDEAEWDPHVWMDAKLWTIAVETISAEMQKIDPDNASTYKTNTDAYIAELKKVDEYCANAIATIPEEQRLLITAHDAFGYFARAYGLEVRAVQGLSTASEAGLKDIEELIDVIVERKVGAIFVEDSVSEEGVKALIPGAKERSVEVQIGGRLFSDAMGPEGTSEGTYIGMMDHNATTIAQALGGEAPEKGMNGKLSGKSE